MDTTTNQRLEEQAFLHQVCISRGKGNLRRSGRGAFIIFSRIGFADLFQEIQLGNPSIQYLAQMKTFF